MRLRTTRFLCVAALSAASGAVGLAQSAPATRFTPALIERADVRAALAYVDRNFEQQVAEWIRITEIPAPSGQEAKRAAYVSAELQKLGLKPTVDPFGNVIARRPGTGGGPTLVFAAHLDTVFPVGTNITVRKMGDGTMHAPGVFDNSASVANMLQAARALHAAKIQTRGDVLFLGTAQEEVGLKGMYYWLEHNKGVADMLVALDSGLGPVNYGALGIYWSRMSFTAAGAHTNNSRGVPNPARAAAQCITDIYTIPLPEPDAPVSAVYNVGGLMTGGSVVNAVPAEVTFSVDLRTVDPQMLKTLDAAILGKCEAAAKAHRVGFTRTFIQRSEAGGRPEHLEDRRRHPLVQTAVDVLEHLGVALPAGREAIASGSTDANVGVVNGVPSIAVGRSRGGDQHTLQEWTDIDSAKIGTKQIILLATALAEIN
ncbi:MAG: M20/M25/M40 family metallo-hydrolase [Acidimicrobiia bacterium]|nr:M20/M25/M40 family metallo-hydrolase [Acidimicrobiia bacterium]